MSRLLLSAVLALFLCFIPWTGHAASDENAGSRYRQAMREAEGELAAQGDASPRGGGWRISEILSIAALGVAVFGLVWLRRRLARTGFAIGPGRTMRIVDRQPLGRQSTMFIVEVENRRYWLAEHSHGVTLLTELPAEPPAAAPEQSPVRD